MKKLLLFLPIIVLMFGSAAQEKRDARLAPNVCFSDIHKDDFKNATIDLLLEYKQECYNDSTAYLHEVTLAYSDSLDLIIQRFNLSKDMLKLDSLYIKEMIFPWADEAVCVSDGDQKFPIMRYDKYKLIARFKLYQHKTPTFEDFLNWIEERK